jgi:hypothetical protein
MPIVTMNELTFAGWLAEFTAVRAASREADGESVLIAAAAIEERQVDEKGIVRRCDIRFNSARGCRGSRCSEPGATRGRAAEGSRPWAALLLHLQHESCGPLRDGRFAKGRG